MKNTDKENVYSSRRLPKDLSFQIGDCVLVRNYRRRSKFVPYFLLEKFCVIEILANVNSLSKENTVSGICLQRDNNDIKLLNGSIASFMTRHSKMIVLHLTKIYTEKMILILLTKASTPIMTKPFKKQTLARFP